MKLFIDAGNTAYFNLQAEKVIGTTWAIDVNFNADGSVALTGGGANLAGGKFPQENGLLLKSLEIFLPIFGLLL